MIYEFPTDGIYSKIHTSAAVAEGRQTALATFLHMVFSEFEHPDVWKSPLRIHSSARITAHNRMAAGSLGPALYGLGTRGACLVIIVVDLV